MSSEISSLIFETFKNGVQPLSWHIYNTDSDMAIVTMFTYTFKHHGLLHQNSCEVVVISAQVFS